MCLTIEEGGITTLWCNATDGYPTPIVRWFIREIENKYKTGYKARSCDGKYSNRTEVLNIGDEFRLKSQENTDYCYKDYKLVTLPIKITSTNDGGFYKCVNTKVTSEDDVIVIIRHGVSSVNASGDICADNSSSNSMCLTIEEGGSTILWCNATDGNPTPIVRWFIREIDKKYKIGYKDLDLGIEGPLLIRNISYHCNSHLVCKVGNYINKDKNSWVEKLIKVYAGRQPNVAVTTLKNGKLQSNYANIFICPIDRLVFSCYVNTYPPPDVIKWNINDTFILTWNFTWNSTWNTTAYLKRFSDVSIPCRINFESIIQSKKVPNLPNATFEWKNINLDCVSYIKCEAVNKFGKDIKTLNLMKGKC